MNRLRRLRLVLLTLCLVLLAACSGVAPEAPEVAVVTRLVDVTREVIVEGEPVVEQAEVTRVVGVEITTAEAGDAPSLETDGGALPSPQAVGGEGRGGTRTPGPGVGPKVDPTRIPGATAVPPQAVARAEGVVATAVVQPSPTLVFFDTPSPPLSLVPTAVSRLVAGEIDDNVAFDDYLLYLDAYEGPAIIPINVGRRDVFDVRDPEGRPILDAQIDVWPVGANDGPVAQLRTHSDGRAAFYPNALPPALRMDRYRVAITVEGEVEQFFFNLDSERRFWPVTHPVGAAAPIAVPLDVLFLVDATGSMSDEIAELKENIEAIAAQVASLPTRPDVRFGLVTYRDRREAYVVQTTDFTADIGAFADRLAEVEAFGGGDRPEDLHAGLAAAVRDVGWRRTPAVRLIFLIGDAPPHLDYGQSDHYAALLPVAAAQGIKIFPLASSGLDEQGAYIFRQMAQYTRARFLFLIDEDGGGRGEATGSEVAAGDYVVTRLDTLIVGIIAQELAWQMAIN